MLAVTEIESDNNVGTKVDFASPPRIKIYIDYNGKEQTRFFVFGDKEYEFRIGAVSE